MVAGSIAGAFLGARLLAFIPATALAPALTVILVVSAIKGLASQVAIQPYLSGVVGQGNQIEFVNLPTAMYRLVVRPAGIAPVELLVDVGSVDTEVVLKVGPAGDGSDGPVLQALTSSCPSRRPRRVRCLRRAWAG